MKEFSVFLRAFEPEDFKCINSWRNDYNIQSLTCGHFRYVSSEMEKSWANAKMLNNRDDIYLSIVLNDGSGRMVGYTSINNINHLDRKAHLGGIVIGDKESRGADILIDTFLLLFQHAFNDLNLNRITGACLETHVQSRQMMESMGMIMEGMEYESILKMGKFHNVCKYVILSHSYFNMIECGGFSLKSIIKRYKTVKTKFEK